MLILIITLVFGFWAVGKIIDKYERLGLFLTGLLLMLTVGIIMLGGIFLSGYISSNFIPKERTITKLTEEHIVVPDQKGVSLYINYRGLKKPFNYVFRIKQKNIKKMSVETIDVLKTWDKNYGLFESFSHKQKFKSWLYYIISFNLSEDKTNYLRLPQNAKIIKRK